MQKDLVESRKNWRAVEKLGNQLKKVEAEEVGARTVIMAVGAISLLVGK